MLAFVSKKTERYHDEMNANVYEKVFIETLKSFKGPFNEPFINELNKSIKY